MKIIVNQHKCTIDTKSIVNENEVNVTKIEFEFIDIPSNYVKEAYFTLEHNNTYKVLIVNNECNIPNEVLTTNGRITLGVVAYLVENEETIVRYNPSPVYFNSIIGSLREADNTEPITPSEMEQFEQALNDGLSEVENVDIDAQKEGTTTTITITNRNGETKSLNVYDGINGQDGRDGTNGINGADGVGISSIAKTGTSGLVDTYTITYTDNNSSTYTVTNGKDGVDGQNGSDYVLTSADKNEIATIVLGELQTVDEVGY